MGKREEIEKFKAKVTARAIAELVKTKMNERVAPKHLEKLKTTEDDSDFGVLAYSVGYDLATERYEPVLFMFMPDAKSMYLFLEYGKRGKSSREFVEFDGDGYDEKTREAVRKLVCKFCVKAVRSLKRGAK